MAQGRRALSATRLPPWPCPALPCPAPSLALPCWSKEPRHQVLTDM